MAFDFSSPGRGQWFLLLAVVLGLIAAGLTYMGLRQASAQQEEGQRTVSPSLVTVVKARQEIPPRVVITVDMVELQEIRRDSLNPAAARELADVVGHATRQTISSGETVLFSKVFPERGEAGLAFTIPVDKRAVSVPISELAGSGGLILPGDRVDIVALCKASVEGATRPAPAGGTIRYTEHFLAITVLQKIEVLAVAQQVIGTQPAPSTVQQVTGTPTARDVPRVDPVVQPAARTVTLAVSPLEAEQLMLYDELCDVRFSVRRFDDAKVEPIPPTELNFGTAR